MLPEHVVARLFGKEPSLINNATSPDSLPEWDSLGHITLITELEITYGVSFSAEEAMSLRDVGTIKRALSEQGAQW